MKNNNNETPGTGRSQVFKFKIDNQQFEWSNSSISVAELKNLAGLPADAEIYLNDEFVPDESTVDLSAPGTEHFESADKGRKFKIIVNGEQKEWGEKKISFRDVIILAYGAYDERPTMVYTVAYEDGPKQNREGSMTVNSVVFVKNKMIFHATATDKS